MSDIGKHFNKQYESYLNSVSKTNRLWYENTNKALNPFLKGDILDVGNGGIFTYDITKANKIYAADISFIDISKLKSYSNVVYKCDDARTLKSIRSNSVDTAIFQLVLHHIVGKSSKETLKNIAKVMESAIRVLKPGGNIIIIEVVVLQFAEFLERFLYQTNNFALSLLKKPMVYLFSRNTILRFIYEAGFEDITYKKISYGKKIDIFNGIKPGLVIVPSWLAPHRCYFFIAKKPKT